jgi:hypothetical protein
MKKMIYTRISEKEFSVLYEQLAHYVETHLNINIGEIVRGLNALPIEHSLKSFSVVNSENGKSFVDVAAAQGNFILISVLEEIGHDFNLKDKEDKTPLYDACDNLKLASVNALLAQGGVDVNRGNSGLIVKKRQGRIEVDCVGKNVSLVTAIESNAQVTATENVITPAAWWEKLPLDGVMMGVSNAAFDKVSQSRRGKVLQLVMFRTLLDMLMMTSHNALSNSVNQDADEETLAPLMKLSFFATIGLTATIRTVGIGLEQSDRPLMQQAKQCMQKLYHALLLYVMYNFFMSDESSEEKLETMLNWISHTAVVMIADKATRTLLNSETVNSFFRTTRAEDQEEVQAQEIQRWHHWRAFA